jgi:hypothetical protein
MWLGKKNQLAMDIQVLGKKDSHFSDYREILFKKTLSSNVKLFFILATLNVHYSL